MALPQNLLARTVVVFMLLGMLSAFQALAVVDAQDTVTYTLTKYDCAPGYDPGSGENLECSWYDVPIGQATITILAFECPGSTVIVAQCEPAGAGAQFSLAPIGTVGGVLQLATGDNGTATIEGAAGPYKLTEAGASPCQIDSEAIDGQGQILLTQSSPVEVRVYNCIGVS